MKKRILTFEGGYNIRDLGAYTIDDNQQTLVKKFIRSGNLDKLPKTSQQQLIEYGLQTVIDIRDEWEAAHYPNPFADSETVDYFNVPLIGDALSHDEEWQMQYKGCQQLHDLYNLYIDHCQKQIATIFQKMASAQGTTIFHCHAGKDRTGIIAALLLDVVGVNTADIVLDYSLSRQYIDHLVTEWREYAIQQGHDLEQLEQKASSNPQTISAMLQHVQQQYGHTTDYLMQCGLSQSDIDTLLQSFIGQNQHVN